jgi:hypothetical protein
MQQKIDAWIFGVGVELSGWREFNATVQRYGRGAGADMADGAEFG